MSSLGSPNPFFIAGKKAYEVERSLRFTGEADDHYLERTPSSAGNRQICTFSCWTKRSNLDVGHCIASAYSGNNNNDNISITFRPQSSGNCELRVVGYANNFRITNRKFRDPSAWFHVVVAFDTTQSSADDRIKIYINGVQETSFSTSGSVTQNMNIAFNDTSVHRIGTQSNALSNTADGYIAEVNFLDGYAYDASYFGETDAITGQWIPKKYVGSYGTNGYYLNFSDNSGTTATTMGKDSSGNGNNFTPNNLAVSDAMKDSPTNNFATMNPLNGYTGLSEGNLRFNAYNDSGGQRSVQSSIALPKSGKWYWEARYQEDYLASKYFGLSQIQMVTGYLTNPSVYYDSAYGTIAATGESNVSGGSWYNIGSGSSVIVSIAVDVDNNSVKYYKNNSLQGTITLPTLTSSQEYFFTWANSSGGSSSSLNDTFNFGADSTFQGQETSGGNTDANGIGDFKYAPPAGHLALCSANLPDPTILLPNKHFDTVLYSGNGSSQTISGLNFAPDWVWIKVRNSSSGRSHILTDTVRGATKSLLLPETDAETTQAQDLTAFTSDGFSVGSNERVNENSKNIVAWNWDAGETDSATYRVVVVSDSGNKYRFRNSANTATFAQSAVVLDLAEGGTYTFDQSDSTMSSHPMKLSTTANGTHGGGTSYNTGVTYQLDGSSVTESAFVSGFSSATSRKLIITVAASAPTLYYYCHYHSGMGSSINTNTTLGSSNFDGDLQSTTKVNATAGFSTVKWTSGANAYKTVGHGLGVKPDIVITKSRSVATGWFTFYDVVDGTNDYLQLNSTASSLNAESYSIVPPTSTVFGTDGAFISGNTNETMIAYVFSSVEGYSKIGSYTGNQNADGTFVYLGFTPAWIIIKNADNATNRQWCIIDATRTTFNKSASAEVLFSTSFGAESVANNNFGQFSSKPAIDILSNGFKVREGETAAYTQLNRNNTHIYLAFAKSPFKNSRAM